jgi:crotonobetainyl-CoA:carnitine CoA-transferase CaiB-like acyl-CoA transferase
MASPPPLSDVFVLDFSKFLPGPYCTWILGDLGAEIVRVEHPRELAKQAQVFGTAGQSADANRVRRARDIFARNKKSVLLDPGDPASRPLLEALVRRADVLVEDYRPGVMDKMGLGYAALAAINPRLIYCSVTLCGQTGPYRDKPGHDPIALSIAGALSRVGENAAAPSFPGVPVADLLTGSNAVIGVLAALHARHATGRGQQVDIAMSDASMALIASIVSRNPDLDRLAPRGQRRVDTGLWLCADGRYVCTTDMEPRYWATFCEVVGRPDFQPLQLDAGRREEVIAALEQIFLTRSVAQWMALFDAAGTQAMPVHEPAEAMHDPHNAARGMTPVYEAPDGTPVQHIGAPIKLSDTPTAFRHLGRLPGEDDAAVREAMGIKTGV